MGAMFSKITVTDQVILFSMWKLNIFEKNRDQPCAFSSDYRYIQQEASSLIFAGVPCSPDQPPTSDPPATTSQVEELYASDTTTSFYGARNWTQGLKYSTNWAISPTFFWAVLWNTVLWNTGCLLFLFLVDRTNEK